MQLQSRQGGWASPQQFEEVANITVHGFGLLFAMVATATMLVVVGQQTDRAIIIGCSIYGVTLCVLFASSVIFHSSLAVDLAYKRALEVLDHCAIYLLIAGTYTPFVLGPLKGPLGWSILAVIWALAFFGIFYKVFFFYKSDALSTLAYVLMGWLIVFAIQPMIQAIGLEGVLWMGLGGLLYTFGALFYVFDHKFQFAHTIWHVFVLAASICHYFVVLNYVIHPLI